MAEEEFLFYFPIFLLPPANEVCEGYVFTGVCLSTGGVACVVAQGGACMVLFGGRAWFYLGGMRGFIGGRAWFYWGGVCGFSSFFGYNEIRSMSGRYASYWNAFLFYNQL